MVNIEDVSSEKQQEREELAAKLDKDLDEHMERMLLKNKDYKYEDGLTVENVEEQCKLIPAFSDGAPTQDEIDASPALQALQALKYECDNPEEGALAHKDDGNYHFQKKDYKTAIIAYSEALRQKHENTLLYAIIYTNRAASHFYLGNNGSALKDAMWALKFEPNHMKAILRCATCCFDLEKYNQCVEWCERGIAINSSNEETFTQMKKKCVLQQKLQEREKRKKDLRVVKNLKKRNDLIDAIKSRNITIVGTAKTLQHRIEAILDSIGKAEDGKIYLDDNQHVHWPFYFVYPEFSQSDFIEDFDEELTIGDQLEAVFSSPAPWDTARAYNVENLEVYFEDNSENLVRVKPETSLKTILSSKKFSLTAPSPVLMVMSKVTDFYKHTLENQRTVDF